MARWEILKILLAVSRDLRPRVIVYVYQYYTA